MSSLLWKSFFEDDIEQFRQILAAASHNASLQNARSVSGGKQAHAGFSSSPGSYLGFSPSLGSRKRHTLDLNKGASPSEKTLPKSLSNVTLGRADLNWRDSRGVTLLHEIASSSSRHASEFANALLEQDLLDLYIQDDESGWTALHRALYFGNITIARSLMDRDHKDAVTHSTINSAYSAVGLIKIKDREGNSPFDVYAASTTQESFRQSSSTPLIGGDISDEDEDMAQGVTGDPESDGESTKHLSARTQIYGDEIFAFGSNKNFTLGFADEDDRQFPERVYLKRPEQLLHRMNLEQIAKMQSSRGARTHGNSKSPIKTHELFAVVQHKPIIVQDVQLAKLHTAILTTDSESNLHMCGVGSGGRLGTGDETTRFAPVNISGGALSGKKVNSIALGQDHTIAITSHGETITWGANPHGQLGYSTSPLSPAARDEKPLQLLPRQVYGPLKRERVVGAAASRIHSVVFAPFALFTFGKNEGQLGLVDSDARSLTSQQTPRRVAAALFSSSIYSVSAIDKATVVLLDSREVWIFANYGYSKIAFHTESFSNYFLKTASGMAHTAQKNPVAKITSGGDTICAMTTLGDVFTIHVSQNLESPLSGTSTTNPSKIRGALSLPQRVWSLQKADMAVRDVDVGQDGSIIICTESGSVWRRVKRAKIKDTSSTGSSEYKSKDYKFSRVPKLTRIRAVRSNAFGGFAAVRQDYDVLKAGMQVQPSSLWSDIFPLLPLHGFGAEDSDTEDPRPRFWTPSHRDDVFTIRRAIYASNNLEEDLTTFLEDKGSMAAKDGILLGTTTSDVRLPVHEFIFAGRSDVFRNAIARFRDAYYFNIAEVLTIEYDREGRIVVLFQGLDLATIVNLVLYLYTDSMVELTSDRRYQGKGTAVSRFRQVRVEVIKLASQLELRKLEQAARSMVEPPRFLHDDLAVSIQDKTLFDGGDLQLNLDGGSVKVHSALLCQRCPFFEGLYQGRAAGEWLSSRREHLREPQDLINVDLTHIHVKTFDYVLRHIYADEGERMFDDVVMSDPDAFLDLILDVLSVANELMLDRLSQCCQKLLGGYVNTRNVCQLLNAIAPCSVSEFKDAALEYCCLNLEGLLENRLLGEMESDLMLELDEAVRENQLANLPIRRSIEDQTQLVESYPELKDSIERNRKIKLDIISLSLRLHERESKASAATKAKADLLEDFETPTAAHKSRRRSSGEQERALSSPSLKAKKSAHDLMFHMEEEENDDEPSGGEKGFGRSPSRPRRPGTPSNRSPLLSTSLPSDHEVASNPGTPFTLGISPALGSSQGLGSSYISEDARSTPDATPTLPPTVPGKKAWASPDSMILKSDMRDIMAQASSTKTSNISMQIQNRDSHKEAALSGTQQSSRLSQRERKRQQQQTGMRKETELQDQKSESKPGESIRTVSSPWQIASRGPKVNLKEVFDGQKGEGVRLPEIVRTTSPMTLRQTVAGRPSQTQRSESDRALHSTSIPGNQSKTQGPPPTRPSTSSSRAVSASAVGSPKSPTIQSIRHLPQSSAEPSLQLSMTDILSQQQTEKQIIKDASAKRSLQEIQQEQAFQEWWDQESAKMKMEAEEEEKSTTRRDRRGNSRNAEGGDKRREGARGNSARGRGGSRKSIGRGKGKESDGSSSAQVAKNASTATSSSSSSTKPNQHQQREAGRGGGS